VPKNTKEPAVPKLAATNQPKPAAEHVPVDNYPAVADASIRPRRERLPSKLHNVPRMDPVALKKMNNRSAGPKPAAIAVPMLVAANNSAAEHVPVDNYPAVADASTRARRERRPSKLHNVPRMDPVAVKGVGGVGLGLNRGSGTQSPTHSCEPTLARRPPRGGWVTGEQDAKRLKQAIEDQRHLEARPAGPRKQTSVVGRPRGSGIKCFSSAALRKADYRRRKLLGNS